MDRLEFLLEFVNVKEWSIEQIKILYQRYNLACSKHGQEIGFDTLVTSRKLEGIFPLESDRLLNKYPEYELKENIFFPALIEIQNEWRNRLQESKEKGIDVTFLNNIASKTEFTLVPSENPLVPKIGPFFYFGGPIETWLEFAFLDVFVSGEGTKLNNLRVCQNPNCGSLFIFNRPKQKFCRDQCRHAYHNHEKIESGYLADHQKRKRAEGKYQ